MQAYLIPYKPGRKLGSGEFETPIEGPILYVPKKGIIHYGLGITGDIEFGGYAITDVYSFANEYLALAQFEQGFSGKHAGTKSDHDLSHGAISCDIQEFKNLKESAMEIALDLEQKISMEKFILNK